MSTLQLRLGSQEYNNWIKAGVCIALTKEGLEHFADEKSREFHTTVVDNIQKANIPITGCSMCNTGKITFTGNNWKIDCGHPYCQEFMKQIVQVGVDPNKGFKLGKSNLHNSNVQLWHIDTWELAKLFMNPGQQPAQKSPNDTDISGIINFISHCQTANNAIAKPASIQKVREARNSIMHNSSMTLLQNDFQTMAQYFVDLLEDPKDLISRKESIRAVDEIKKVMVPGFQVLAQHEKKVLEDLADFQNRYGEMEAKIQEIHTANRHIAARFESDERTAIERHEKMNKRHKKMKYQIEQMHSAKVDKEDIVDHIQKALEVKDYLTRKLTILPQQNSVLLKNLKTCVTLADLAHFKWSIILVFLYSNPSTAYTEQSKSSKLAWK